MFCPCFDPLSCTTTTVACRCVRILALRGEATRRHHVVGVWYDTHIRIAMYVPVQTVCSSKMWYGTDCLDSVRDPPWGADLPESLVGEGPCYLPARPLGSLRKKVVTGVSWQCQTVDGWGSQAVGVRGSHAAVSTLGTSPCATGYAAGSQGSIGTRRSPRTDRAVREGERDSSPGGREGLSVRLRTRSVHESLYREDRETT